MGGKRKLIKKWVRSLPRSKMVFPKTLDERARYLVWKICAPIHPYLRDLFLLTGLMKHEGRQNYLLGRLTPEHSVEKLVDHLIENGYGNHFLAWKDDDEILGLRSVVSFQHQYHLRIFEDGEVRGHFEYTPECHPFKHLRKIGQEARREEFMTLLNGWVTPA